MTWRIITSDSAWADLEHLTTNERRHVADDLATWIDTGPPRGNTRTVGGADLFEDQLPSGYLVTYFIDDSVPYAAVLRIRKLSGS